MTAAFFLCQDVGFCHELLVWLHRAWLAENLATLNSVTVNTAKQRADVVASLALIEQLAEHFNAGAGRLRCWLDADDFNFFTNLDDTTLNAAGHNSPTARDREHVFDWHQEWLVDWTLWCRDVSVYRCHKFTDCIFADLLVRIFKSGQSRTLDDWNIIAWEVVRRQKFTNFEFDEFEQFSVVNLVNLVEVHNDRRNANLTSEQNVLTCLWHWAVSSRANQDRAVHLRRTGDHVLHIVSVAGAINVGVVASRCFIFDVRCRNGDAACLFFWRCVDLVITLVFTKVLGDRSCQRRLAMVNVTNRSDVYVRLVALKLALCHFNGSLTEKSCTAPKTGAGLVQPFKAFETNVQDINDRARHSL